MMGTDCEDRAASFCDAKDAEPRMHDCADMFASDTPAGVYSLPCLCRLPQSGRWA